MARNQNIFMARQRRRGKRVEPGINRRPKINRKVFNIRRKLLGMTFEEFYKHVISKRSERGV